jgi:hypothetical protein
MQLNDVNSSKSGLQFADCSNTNQFICEVRIIKQNLSEFYEIQYFSQTIEVSCPPHDDKNVIFELSMVIYLFEYTNVLILKDVFV